MKKHNGMRPQDVIILLKLSTLKNTTNWHFYDIANHLKMSTAEISESLERSKLAKLVSENKRELYTESFLEFLIYGVKYVFPVIPGRIVKGIPTAHSAPPLNKIIQINNELFVWKSSNGTIKGQEIQPLYKTIPEFILDNQEMYELIALVDVLRIGKMREVQLAIEFLNQKLK
ncbi:MAG: hypothetical protein H6Q25_273 [Bacteroidetes bacterium]|nr:hypothetical protein [Bacteroidota bacterium]